MKLTPMMKQYLDIKKKYKDAILLFRLGDFYEAFFDDAKIVSKVLNIVLTKRQTAPMAGIPYHALDAYLKKLVDAGYKVAICEQMEDPRQAKGIVKREVVRVVTPGTILEDELLPSSNNYILSIYDNIAVYADVSTGEVFIRFHKDGDELFDLAESIGVSQVICPLEENQKVSERARVFVDPLDEWYYTWEGAVEEIKKAFNVEDISHLELGEAVIPLVALIRYLKYTLVTDDLKLKPPRILKEEEWLVLDSSTVENLSLVPGDREKNLYAVLNNCRTSMGSRLLKKWILQPLKSRKEIEKRQNQLQSFYEDQLALNEIREYLKGVYDIERIVTRLIYSKTVPKDLVSLRESLRVVQSINDVLRTNEKLSEFLVPELSDLVEFLDKALKDEPASVPGDGGVIKEGFSKELDDYLDLLQHTEKKLKEFEYMEKKRTGIQNLKVGYNQVFGYYIEVSKGNLSRVPEYYERRQTLVNSERFITPELKEFENKVLSAKEKVEEIEKMLYQMVLDKVKEKIEEIENVASALSYLDVITTLAYDAILYNYAKPQFSDGKLEIIEGRHPVVERFVENYTPNDVYMDDNKRFLIITGPNMSGKSTYIRQIGLIAIMAQMGSFVPAKKASLPIFDRVFTRMGARDDISGGKSTFMVEMSEVALILSHATKDSLVLLDEVGRGTSTFDGISIAWAVSEYLHNNIKAKTAFATHFTELTELAGFYKGIKNLTIAVTEREGKVMFLHKVIEGVADKSYGIEVAQLAGLPQEVIERAKEVLDAIVEKSELEQKLRVLDKEKIERIKKKKKKHDEDQLKLF
ncbi:MAG: DNA mismatch repair protein MutS [Thermotogaceae bacterium]|nr:DNA mismatch repair protein MutS [Thermotogaceae bacterium]